MVFGAVRYGPGEEAHEGEGGDKEDPADDQLGPVPASAFLPGGGRAGRVCPHCWAARAAGTDVQCLLFLLLLGQPITKINR